MAEFNPNETSRLKLPTPWGLFEFTSKRMAEVIAFVACLGTIGTLFLQWHAIKATDALTVAVAAGTAETRVRLEKMDASNRYVACLTMAKDAKDADRQCRLSSGAQQ